MQMSSFAYGGGFTFGAPKNPAVERLQRALTALALSTGDKALIVGVDGLMGPKTAAAVNRALQKHVKTAPASLRTGKLTQAQIISNAATIAGLFAAAAAVKPAAAAAKAAPAAAPKAPAAAPKASKAEIQKLQAALRALGTKIGDKTLVIGADGVVGPKTLAAVNRAITVHKVATSTQPVTAAALTSANVKTLTSAVSAKAAAVSKPVPAAPAKPTKSPTVQRLQQAVAKLGTVVKDTALKLAADGLIGPKTAAAVNRAMKSYVAGAPANLRTGALSQADIVAQAAVLAPLVETEIVRRGAKPPAKPAAAPSKTVARSGPIAELQTELNALAKAVNDPGLTVVVDGINGPKTTAAVNRALQKHIPEATPDLRKGKLTVAQVSTNAGLIRDLVAASRAKRGAPRPPAPIPPPPEPEGVEEPTPDEEPTAAEPAPAPVPAYAPAAAVPAPVAPSAPVPPPMMPSYTPPGGGGGGGGGGVAPEPGAEPSAEPGAEAATPDDAAAPAAKAFPWVPVLIGGGVVTALGATLFFTMRGRRPASLPAYRMSPSRRRRPSARYAY